MFRNILAMTTALLLSVGMASAATVDFGEEARINGERGGSETIDNDQTDGLAVTIGAVNGVAYLDGPDGGRNAGLGVCSTGLTNADQCNQSNDDNIDINGTSGAEIATVSFDEDVTVNSVEVRKDDHRYVDEDDTILVSFDDGDTFSEYVVGADGVVDLGDETLVAGTEIQFKRGGDEPTNFYVTTMTVGCEGVCGTGGPTPVPIPGALILLLTGLGGLFGFKGLTGVFA